LTVRFEVLTLVSVKIKVFWDVWTGTAEYEILLWTTSSQKVMSTTPQGECE